MVATAANCQAVEGIVYRGNTVCNGAIHRLATVATKKGESRMELALIVFFLKSQVSSLKSLTLILINHDFDNGLGAISANAKLSH